MCVCVGGGGTGGRGGGGSGGGGGRVDVCVGRGGMGCMDVGVAVKGRDIKKKSDNYMFEY